MAKTLLFNKPFQVLSQFSPVDNIKGENKKTLAEYIDIPKVYPAGRLDFDSEGLMLLTDDGKLQARVSDPRFNKTKTYLSQVDGQPSEQALVILANGVELKDGFTKPAKVRMIEQPNWLWPRMPPIRVRKDIPTQWLEIEISEGRNRQVRRMTAAIGHPTLRLVRIKIGDWSLEGILPGEFRLIE